MRRSFSLTSLAVRGTLCLGLLAAWGCGGADSSAAPPPASDGGVDSGTEVDSGVTFDAPPPTGCAPDCPIINLARGTYQDGLTATSLLVHDEVIDFFNEQAPTGFYRLSTQGGSIEPLFVADDFGAAPDCSRLSFDGTYLYFPGRRSSNGALMKLLATGGTPEVVSATSEVRCMSIDDSGLYYTGKNNGASGVWRLPKDNGPASQLSAQAEIRALSVHNASVYYSVGNGGLRVIDPDGTDRLINLDIGGSYAHEIVVDETSAYVATEYALIARVPLDGGPTEDLMTYDVPYNMVIEGSTLYYRGGGRAIFKRELPSGPQVEVVAHPGGAASMALDATHIYWSQGGSSGTIRKTTK